MNDPAYQIFDILGVSAREDSYTNLIACYFNDNEQFKNDLLSELKARKASDWEAKTRLPIKLKGSRKIIPDLILFSKKQNQIIIIEVKVFANEGKDQTDLYSEIRRMEQLDKELKLENSEKLFYFLTLNGNGAKSKHFENINFSLVEKLLPSITLPRTKLEILIAELKFRLKEYYEFPAPGPREVALEYLKNTYRLVNQQRTFEKLIDFVLPRSGRFEYKTGTSNNQGDGLTYYIYWYKEGWEGEKIEKAKSGRNCFEYHFEFHWHTNNKKTPLAIYLHYHVHPYKTKGALKKLQKQEVINSQFINEYNERRDQLFHYLKSNCLDSKWTHKNTFLRLAQYEFSKSITVEELKDEIEHLVNQLEAVIDEFQTSKPN